MARERKNNNTWGKRGRRKAGGLSVSASCEETAAQNRPLEKEDCGGARTSDLDAWCQNRAKADFFDVWES